MSTNDQKPTCAAEAIAYFLLREHHPDYAYLQFDAIPDRDGGTCHWQIAPTKNDSHALIVAIMFLSAHGIKIEALHHITISPDIDALELDLRFGTMKVPDRFYKYDPTHIPDGEISL